jgi:HTH-type transcriptional regulator/antitoxin HigA
MTAQFVNIAEHPGVYIHEEMVERGWLNRDLAYILGVPESTVSAIINGKRGISAEMAKALGDAFDVSAEFFANLQNAYELARADAPDPAVAKRGRIQAQYPLREMIKRGWIVDSTLDLLEPQIANFFEVKSLNQVPHLAHAARRSNSYYENVPAAQLAWLFRVRQIANSMVTPRYAPARLTETTELLKSLRSDINDVRHVPRLLNECGVRFVVVEGLPGGKIDGVCFWLNKQSPVIGMSLRLDRIDNFWFVLRHEIAHVLHRHGQDTEIIDVEIDKASDSLNDEEKIANKEASEFCVPQDQMLSFFNRKNPFFSERDTIAFAKKMDVHPGLVVGQIQRLADRWDFLRRYQVKVREKITQFAVTDGWGDVAPVQY